VWFLNQEWNDGLATLWIRVKFLLVVAMLAKSPHGHLIHASNGKDERWQSLGHDGEREPSAELVRVVRARDKVEEPSERVDGGTRNGANLGARRSQMSQSNVNRQGTKRVKDKSSEASVDLSIAIESRCVIRVIDVVGNIGSEAPIVNGVLENVHEWHGGMRESVYEDSLKETLGVVECPAGACQLDGVVSLGAGGAINDAGAHIENEVDDERTGVLGQKDRGPAHLWAQILQIELEG